MFNDNKLRSLAGPFVVVLLFVAFIILLPSLMTASDGNLNKDEMCNSVYNYVYNFWPLFFSYGGLTLLASGLSVVYYNYTFYKYIENLEAKEAEAEGASGAKNTGETGKGGQKKLPLCFTCVFAVVAVVYVFIAYLLKVRPPAIGYSVLAVSWSLAGVELFKLLIWDHAVNENPRYRARWPKLSLGACLIGATVAFLYYLRSFGADSITAFGTYGGITVVMSFISVSIYHHFILHGELRHFMQVYDAIKARSQLVVGIVIVIFLALAVLFVTSSRDPSSTWAHVVSNPGGVFAIATGTLSVIGVYLTLISVMESYNLIVSFPSFLNRAARLIDETDSNDYIQMMVLTPAMGCLILPPHIWRHFYYKIMDPNAKVALTCLSESDEAKWFDAYKLGLQERDQETMGDRIKLGLEASKQIRAALNSKSGLAKHEGQTLNLDVVELDWNHMPRTYYIANTHRAIIATPLFLPYPGTNVFHRNVHKRPVQMIGFETRDPHIVDSIHQEIETRRNAAAADGQVNGAQVPAASSGEGNTTSA